ncbi:hypothetical protein SY88_11505 [Clostridiales bacterium PH28_bin88]|nr:hypothetical protein SY88_11505 [Clostridiales bacterium PH28_bin88]
MGAQSGHLSRLLGSAVLVTGLYVAMLWSVSSRGAALAFASAVFLLGLWRPVIAIYAFFLVVLSYGSSALESGESLVRFVVPAASASLVLRQVLHTRAIRLDKGYPFLASFMAYAIGMSLLRTEVDPRMLGVIAIVLVMRSYLASNPKSLPEVRSLFVLAAVASLATGALRMNKIVMAGVERLAWGFTDVNEYARLMLFGIVLLVSSHNGWHPRIRTIVLVGLVVGLVSTFSKGGIAVAIILVVLMKLEELSRGAVSGRGSKVTYWRTMSATVAGILLVLVLARTGTDIQAIIRSRLVGSMDVSVPLTIDTLTTDRWQLWINAVEAYVSASPGVWLFGGGGGWSRIVGSTVKGQPISTHQTFLEVLLDYGIVGLLLFLLWLFCTIRWQTRGRGWVRSNLLWLAGVGTYFSLAWVFSWSNACFFGLVGLDEDKTSNVDSTRKAVMSSNGSGSWRRS